MTPLAVCFLCVASSVLTAFYAGLVPAAISFVLSAVCFLLLKPVKSENFFPKLLFSISFVLRLYGLLLCADRTETGWRAILLFLILLALTVFQISPNGAGRGWFAAIPLALAALVLCWSPFVGGNFAFPPAWKDGAGTLPCLLSSLFCPLSAALLPANTKKKPLPLLFACLLAGVAVFPAVFFGNLFGSEAILFCASPFCAASELKQVVYGTSAGAYISHGDQN